MNDPIISTDNQLTRREACLSIARYAALVGIGLLWAGLTIRSARNVTTNGCSLSPQCQACSQLNQCNLPQAADTRNGPK